MVTSGNPQPRLSPKRTSPSRPPKRASSASSCWASSGDRDGSGHQAPSSRTAASRQGASDVIEEVASLRISSVSAQAVISMDSASRGWNAESSSRRTATCPPADCGWRGVTRVSADGPHGRCTGARAALPRQPPVAQTSPSSSQTVLARARAHRPGRLVPTDQVRASRSRQQKRAGRILGERPRVRSVSR